MLAVERDGEAGEDSYDVDLPGGPPHPEVPPGGETLGLQGLRDQVLELPPVQDSAQFLHRNAPLKEVTAYQNPAAGTDCQILSFEVEKLQAGELLGETPDRFITQRGGVIQVGEVVHSDSEVGQELHKRARGSHGRSADVTEGAI